MVIIDEADYFFKDNFTKNALDAIIKSHFTKELNINPSYLLFTSAYDAIIKN